MSRVNIDVMRGVGKWLAGTLSVAADPKNKVPWVPNSDVVLSIDGVPVPVPTQEWIEVLAERISDEVDRLVRTRPNWKTDEIIETLCSGATEQVETMRRVLVERIERELEEITQRGRDK